MKSVLAIIGFCLVVLTGVSAADIPRDISYQGKLDDTLGTAVPDGDYIITFSLYDGEIAPTPLWTEEDTVLVTSGLFNSVLNNVPEGVFLSSDIWLGITVDSDPELSPRTKLTSTGYSYVSLYSDTANFAVDAQTIDGLTVTELIYEMSAAPSFRCYAFVRQGTFEEVCSPSGTTRLITSIIVTGSNSTIFVDLKIDGATFMKVGTQPSQNTVIWSCEGGAGIELGPSEAFQAEIPGIGDAWVTVIGYEVTAP